MDSAQERITLSINTLSISLNVAEDTSVRLATGTDLPPYESVIGFVRKTLLSSPWRVKRPKTIIAFVVNWRSRKPIGGVMA